ncbi:MAG TPA: FAD-dependent monooxygenase [Gaiellaceae bacterium]|nr:FAD-dependent monooxygenase [Gaiellaceae bacterium]
MADALRIAIVGAGIGGLAAAHALRAGGHDVVVYEQAPSFEPVGASIDVGPNAIRLLDALGLGPAIRRVGVRPEWIELLRWQDSSTLLRMPHGEAAERYFGAPLLDFLRSDLHELLTAELPPSRILLGHRAVAVEGTTVTFDNGAVESADLVVAADGVKSTIRQLLVGADEAVFSGTVVYRGLLSRERAFDLHPDGVNRYWLGPKRHAVAYWIDAGRTLAVNTAVQDTERVRESWTEEVSSDEVLTAFAGWHEGLLELLSRVDRFLRSAVLVRKPLEHWAFGNVVLLGDAAHAMEPFQAQGAAQAIEDAYVLADVLSGAEAADLPVRLRDYEERRMARASDVQASSAAAAGNFYLDDGPEQQARDARYTRLLDELPWGHRQPLWEHDVRATVEA